MWLDTLRPAPAWNFICSQNYRKPCNDSFLPLFYCCNMICACCGKLPISGTRATYDAVTKPTAMRFGQLSPRQVRIANPGRSGHNFRVKNDHINHMCALLSYSFEGCWVYQVPLVAFYGQLHFMVSAFQLPDCANCIRGTLQALGERSLSLVVDESGTVTSVGSSPALLFGFNPTELMGQKASSCIGALQNAGVCTPSPLSCADQHESSQTFTRINAMSYPFLHCLRFLTSGCART